MLRKITTTATVRSPMERLVDVRDQAKGGESQVELPQTGTFHSGNSSNVSKGYRFEDTDHDSSDQSPADMMIYNNKTEKKHNSSTCIYPVHVILIIVTSGPWKNTPNAIICVVTSCPYLFLPSVCSLKINAALHTQQLLRNNRV